MFLRDILIAFSCLLVDKQCQQLKFYLVIMMLKVAFRQKNRDFSRR